MFCFENFTRSRLQPFRFEKFTRSRLQPFLSGKVAYKTNNSTRRDKTYIPLAVWDGEKATINKKGLAEDHPSWDQKEVDEESSLLEGVLNSQQVAKCPFCSRPEHVSAIMQGAEHSRSECHEGRAEHYFSEGTIFTPKTYNALPYFLRMMEKSRVMKGYKYQGNGPRIMRANNSDASNIWTLNFSASRVVRDLSMEYFPRRWKNEYKTW